MAEREHFLDEIRRLGKRQLDDGELNGLHRELSEHLDAAIQARLELGASPADAETESVRAMGPAKLIVKRFASVAKPRRVWFTPAFVGLSTVVGLLFLLSQIISAKGDVVWFVRIYNCMLAAEVALLLVGWRQRRPDLGGAVVAMVPLYLCSYVAFLGLFMQMPTSLPSSVSSEYATLQSRVQTAEEAQSSIAIFETSATDYANGVSRRVSTRTSEVLTIREFQSRDEGLRYISTYRERSLPRLSERASDLAGSKAALASYLARNQSLTYLSAFGPAWAATWQLALVALVFNLFGAALRFLWDQQRTRLRRRTHRLQ